MEHYKISYTYNFLKAKVSGLGYSLELGETYSKNNHRFYFDLVVKKNNKVVAVFEFKEVIDWNRANELLKRKCGVIQDVFSNEKPLIYISDGEFFSQFNTNGKFESKIQKEDVVKAITKLGASVVLIEPQIDAVLEILKGFNNVEMNKFIKIVNDDRSKCFDCDANSFYFKDKYEKLFFRHLLGNSNNDILYRYTSLDTLFKTLTTRKQYMASILGMNDKTESFYADHYLSQRINSTIIDTYDVIEQYKKGCYCFILSCVTDEKENIRMWDDYGDCAKGVRITLTPKRNDNLPFFVAPISYAKSDNIHPEIELLAKLRQVGWDMKMWNVWQHFFKPNEFTNEREIRMLYIYEDSPLPKDDIMWLYKAGTIFPLIMFGVSADNVRPFPYMITGITFGPLSHNQEANKCAIIELIKSNHINVDSKDLKELFQKSQIQEKYENVEK